VLSAQFSRDGLRIVTASWDKTARVWDAATGQSLVTLAGHEAGVKHAQFSPDGARIVTASGDKTARVWDAATGQSLVTLAGHEAGVWSAQFSPDGARIVTASRDKTARIWTILPTSAGPPPAWFADFLRFLAQMRLNADGELEILKPDDWLTLREKMRTVVRTSVGKDTPYLRILRRFVRE
jgi:dipeptidyl aminopeptidase/acylaminoacyl peptidase